MIALMLSSRGFPLLESAFCNPCLDMPVSMASAEIPFTLAMTRYDPLIQITPTYLPDRYGIQVHSIQAPDIHCP